MQPRAPDEHVDNSVPRHQRVLFRLLRRPPTSNRQHSAPGERTDERPTTERHLPKRKNRMR
jgi:hypothetical protein